MTTLVVGASGATGRLLVKQLLDRGESVRVIVRSASDLPVELHPHANLSVITADVLDLSYADLSGYVRDCSAVASCLGHNLTFKGMFGQPRQLVNQAVRRLCDAIRSEERPGPVRLVLMNTTGVRNRDLNESISFAQKCVIGLLRLLLPPHRDNELAADFLRTQIGSSDLQIEWTVVRPDGLIDSSEVSGYDLHPSPIRSAIFDAGKTSRINVGYFMAELISGDVLWEEWRGRMPVIYNQSDPE